MTDRLLSTSEASRALGINRATLARWVTRYGLRPAEETIGGHYRWDLDDLRRQVQAIREREK